MLSKRDYLRAHGFVVGERGRFSKEMLAVLEDYVEPTTDDTNTNDSPVAQVEIAKSERFADGRFAIERGNNLPPVPDIPGIEFGIESYA